jgi:hypothetical protein
MNVTLNSDGISSLIAGGESKWLEFKANVPPDQVIAKHLVAFGNTEGGVVLFGIGDKGTILGIPENKIGADIARLKRLASSLLPYPAEVDAIDYQGKSLIYIKVEKAPESFRPLMTAHGEIYTRHSDRIHANHLAQNLVDASAKRDQPKAEQEKAPVRVFIAMSFREEEEPALVDYYRAMERASSRVDVRVQLSRIDLVEGDYEISQQIMDEIDKCQVLIADFTMSPRNVYFEVGYCRGRKDIQIIQTARKDTVLEFDVRNWRTLFYKNATELEEKLTSALKGAVSKVHT